MGRTIFIAGIYGTGKSTLCSKLSDKMQIPFFSAGDLISESNGEIYGATKAVADKEINQMILAKKVQKLLQAHDHIFLAGHFCIFNSATEVDVLPDSIFQNLNIEQIVLLEAEVHTVIKHLKSRDNKIYHHEDIAQLMMAERGQGTKIAKELDCQLSIYKMTFSEEDTDNVIAAIAQGGFS